MSLMEISMTKRILQTALPVLIGAACLTLWPLPAHSQNRAEGFYRVQERNGVWWFIQPDGRLMLSMGVDAIRYCPDKIRGTGPCPYMEAVKKIYGGRDAWESAVVKRLHAWGFNTIGAWSDTELESRGTPYAMVLDIAARSGANWQHGQAVDVFAPRFEKTAKEIAQKECAPRKDDPNLIGYFSDNELRWGADWRGKQNMLEMYLEMPPHAAGRHAAVEFLRDRYSDNISKLNQSWNVKAKSFDHVPGRAATSAYQADSDAFVSRVAERYFRICAQAIKSADPNHLYLGARFAGFPPPDPVVRAAHWADVVSVNIYDFDPRPRVEHSYKLSGRPVMVTEFAFRATDSGLPNTKGAGPKVPNQKARAKAYRDFVTWLEGMPQAVGYHWFKWNDEPKQGRFDGENSNYGLVNIEDKPYQEFVEAVTAANREAVRIHQQLAKHR
jgi:hypothetical protein